MKSDVGERVNGMGWGRKEKWRGGWGRGKGKIKSVLGKGEKKVGKRKLKKNGL